MDVLINVYLLHSSTTVLLWVYNMPLKIHMGKGFYNVGHHVAPPGTYLLIQASPLHLS